MANTVDLVKAAQNREYSNFEDMAKEALMTKIGENLQLKGFMNKLDVAKGLAEADELSPKQKKLDKDKDGKIGSDDLKKVRNEDEDEDDLEEGDNPFAKKDDKKKDDDSDDNDDDDNDDDDDDDEDDD